METKTALTSAQCQSLVQLATSLNLTVSWDYNHQNIKTLLAQHAPGIDAALWWPQPEGFVPLTDGAAERFAPFVSVTVCFSPIAEDEAVMMSPVPTAPPALSLNKSLSELSMPSAYCCTPLISNSTNGSPPLPLIVRICRRAFAVDVAELL